MSKRAAETWNVSMIVGVGVSCLIVGYLIGAAGRAPRPESAASEPPARAAVRAAPAPEPEPESEPQAVVERPGSRTEPTPPRLQSSAAPAAPEPIPRGDGSKIALVIDDLGRRVEDVDDLLELGVPLSFGVLPFETRTRAVQAELKRRGAEVLLHLPMQPRVEADPGPGALTRGMSDAELEAATRWALAAVADASGVNNHMGSELSTDADRMRAILGVLAERDLFYLDSRTSPDSVGYRVAREVGLAAAERHVFLDAEIGPEAIHAQFRRLLEVARGRGSAVAIAHPHADTLAVLRVDVPRAVAAGYEFVPVSRLTSRAAGPPLAR